jgi:L-rhamnose isomerase/sugar isomerase
MTYKDQFNLLADSLTRQGLDVSNIKAALKKQKIETPSWGYANSGTRFKNFMWPGAAQTTREKIDDAALVHMMTGIAPSVAIHIPWDVPENGDYPGLREYAEMKGISIGAVNPNVFQDDEYRLGSLGNPNPANRECRKQRFEAGLSQVYGQMPHNGRMLIEYKFFEPAFYSTDIPDWGTAYAWTLKLGERAQVLVDLGHHASGVNIEQIVAFLLDEGKMGGFHFNNRKYADDDLIVGSVNPYELFLVFNELTGAVLGNDEPAKSTASNVAYMIDQSHNIEGKLAPMIISVLNCQEAFAKSLLVPLPKLAEAQRSGDVLGAHHILTEAYRTDVRPLLAIVREEMDVPKDPISAYQASGYEAKIAADRGKAEAGGGYQN